MTWLQKLAWEEAFNMLSRGLSQHKKMGFKTLDEAAAFEFKRVQGLEKLFQNKKTP